MHPISVKGTVRSAKQESQAVTAYIQYSIAIAVHNDWGQETSGSVKYECEKEA